jgi:hypothetical protein
MILGNPVVAHGAEFVDVSMTCGVDGYHERDYASTQHQGRSYPEHFQILPETGAVVSGFWQSYDALAERLTGSRCTFTGCGWAAPSVARA